MSEARSTTKPKFFTFFRVICIVLGCIGIIGSGILILMSYIPSTKAMFEAQGQTSLLTLIGLIQNAALLIASIWIFKLKEVGRILIIACTLWSLLQTVYYYMPVVTVIPLLSFSSLLTISLCIVNVLILIYFMRRDVKAYVVAQG
jgi:hypothetical protein